MKVENPMPSQSAPILENPVSDSAQAEKIAGANEPGENNQKRTILIGLVVLILLIGLTVGGVLFLMNQSVGEVARVRDIFIIFMAVQSLLTGLALVILMIQLARLINLLQNEIKPILETTRDTANNLRGTTYFLGKNLVEPVMKLNEYLAGFTQLISIIGLSKRSPRRNQSKGD
jgi:hypothetical protein